MKLLQKYIFILILIASLGILLIDFIFLPLITKSSNNIYVPDVRYNSLYRAEELLVEAGFNIEIIQSQYNENYKPNTVIKTTPRPFTKVKKGRLIKLTVTGNKEKIILSNYIGMSLNNTKLTLSRHRLSIDTLIFEYNENFKKDHIVSQYPKNGKTLETNDKVTFVVSLGTPPNYYIVPNLVNIHLNKGKEIISKAGLIIGTITKEYNNDYLNNTILEQNLTAGVKLSFPHKINLIVSTDIKE